MIGMVGKRSLEEMDDEEDGPESIRRQEQEQEQARLQDLPPAGGEPMVRYVAATSMGQAAEDRTVRCVSRQFRSN